MKHMPLFFACIWNDRTWTFIAVISSIMAEIEKATGINMLLMSSLRRYYAEKRYTQIEL